MSMISADIYNNAQGDRQPFPENLEKTETKSYLNLVLPACDTGEINNEIKKHYPLDRTKKKIALPVCKPRRRKNNLSMQERRQLGLYTLPRHSLKFHDYIPLHKLWCNYMRSCINLKEYKDKGVQAVSEQASLQLLKADYHGAMVTVKRSRCPSLVGIHGILLMDTKNTLKIICKDNTVRTIPKENSMFSIILDGVGFTIFGKHFQIKPIERSTKKIKNRSVSDL